MVPIIVPAGPSLAFTLVRVPRGESRPSEEEFRTALQGDRERLGLPQPNGPLEFQVAGPYAIVVDGVELDEYVVWEE